jgi:thiamine transporter
MAVNLIRVMPAEGAYLEFACSPFRMAWRGFACAIKERGMKLKQHSQMSKTAIMVEGALMVALGVVLSLIPFFRMPWGGSVTCFSTLPLVIMSLRHGAKWGVGAAAVFGFAHAMQGLGSVAAAGTVFAMALCVLLDYLVGYAVVGFSGPIARMFAHPLAGVAAGVAATGLMRLSASFLSGVLIWGSFAPAGTPVWIYSLTYNMGWCLPDVAIVLAASLALARVPALGTLAYARSRWR